MSEALRSVMAEFGFDVDLPTLERLDAKLKAVVGTTKKTTDANDGAAKSVAKVVTAEDRLVKIREAAHDERATHGAKQQFDASAAGKEHAAWKRLTAAEEGAKKPVTGLSGLLEKLHAKTQTAIGKALPASFQKLGRSMGIAEGDFAAMGEVATGATAAVIAVFVKATQAAFAFADAFAADAEALRDTARESRVTTTELQELDHAAVQGGVGVERMRSGVATFGASLRQAEHWGNGTTGMLRRLGVTARGADGHIRPTADVMGDVAVALDRVQSPFRKARIATQLFGESGRRMLDVLHGGAGGLRELQDSFAELGGGARPRSPRA